MGCCTVRDQNGNQVRQFTASNQDQCARGAYGAYEKATFTEADCGSDPTGPGGPICFGHQLANYLGENLPGDDVAVYSTWGTLSLIYDFRDLVLEQSETGKHVLALYRQHMPRAREILQREPDMLYRALRLMLLGALYARGVLLVVSGQRPRGVELDVPVNPEVLDQTLEWLREFRELAGEQGMNDAIDFGEDLLNRTRELTPSQVWELLQEPPRAAASGA